MNMKYDIDDDSCANQQVVETANRRPEKCIYSTTWYQLQELGHCIQSFAADQLTQLPCTENQYMMLCDTVENSLIYSKHDKNEEQSIRSTCHDDSHIYRWPNRRYGRRRNKQQKTDDVSLIGHLLSHSSYNRNSWSLLFVRPNCHSTSNILLIASLIVHFVALFANSQSHPDPRPTIYSGDVSFGLLLSAHSTELPPEASSVMVNYVSPPSNDVDGLNANHSVSTPHTRSPFEAMIIAESQQQQQENNNERIADHHYSLTADSQMQTLYGPAQHRTHDKRQIFEKIASSSDRSNGPTSSGNSLTTPSSALSQSLNHFNRGFCSIIDTNALYAGMAAIWSSHQANLIGDSYLNIGAYIYDSCSDLDVGQRQSVRIVSNLNAFQQTTCDSPKGSPISVTIAHGDQQTKAIQLLTSFKVPVITTKENFAIDDYNTFTDEQKRYLFTTAPSSRFLANGALQFSRRIAHKSSSSLANNHNNKSSSKNELIIISSNLPSKFIDYLKLTIPLYHNNYEMLQSSEPIDQIKSTESLESILASKQSTNDDGTDQSQSGNTSTSEQQTTTIHSPIILLFITRSEAFDLVTRLRNDLAAVSKYFSLIVITREDISKELKTIFTKRTSSEGSLCSRKSFYLIAPKPEDTSEFNRYFRDTVQLEGEASDHPLICEFAKYQSNSKSQVEPDELSAEPVIKAVWVAASALKSIHNRECKSASSTMSLSGTSNSANGQSTKNQPNQCLSKMNRNLTQLVYKSLKRLDARINSTGLTSLDGFRLKFDKDNELITNKYSIKYISNDCDIAELGEYTEQDKPQLNLDEETLRHSYEATRPQPWPTASSNTQETTYRGKVMIPFERQAEASEESVNNNNNGASDDSETDETPDEERQPVGGNYDQTTTSNIVLHKKRLPENSTRIVHDKKSKGGSFTDRTIPATSSDAAHNFAALNDRDFGRSSSSSTINNRVQKLEQQVAGALIDFIDGKRINKQDATVLMANRPDIHHSVDRLWPNPGQRSTDSKSTGIRLVNEEQIDPSLRDDGRPMSNAQVNSVVDTSTGSGGLINKPDSIHEISEDGDELKAKASTEAPFTMSILPTTVTQSSTLSGQHSNGGLVAPIRHDKAEGAPDIKHNLYRQQSARSTNSDWNLNDDEQIKAVKSNHQRSLDNMYNGHTFGGGHYILNGGREHSTQPTMIPSEMTNTDSVTTSDANIFNPFTNVPPPFNELGTITTSSLSPLDGAVDDPSSMPIKLVTHPNDLHTDQGSTTSRIKMKQHLKWIYTSWIALSILSANIIGALITLYVLTFLLMKNCEGSLDRDNQSMRSIHLFTIIVVFFGSTLFVIYPTPALCLFRTSWHNFALVLLFGTLLLRAMQTRALASIGLGGRQNRLNQFLTLIFMVSVQVAIEVQRWRYETKNEGSNFIQFPLHINSNHRRSSNNNQQQYLIKVANNNNQHQIDQNSNSAIDYCLADADDFLYSQLYVGFIIILLILYSFTTRREGSYSGHHHCHSHHHMASPVHLVTGGPSANSFGAPSGCVTNGNHIDGGNAFIATIICVPVYSFSIVLHVYVQNGSTRDVICSITMILIAFSVLIGIFAPIMIQIHRYGKLVSLRVPSTIEARVAPEGAKASSYTSSSSTVFGPFPPDSSDQQQHQQKHQKHPQRRNGFNGGFSETKQSRNNMSAALSKLGPSSADALRNMGYINADNINNNNLVVDEAGNYLLTVPNHESARNSPKIIRAAGNPNNDDIRCENAVVSPSVASSGSSEHHNLEQPTKNLIQHEHRPNKKSIHTPLNTNQRQQVDQFLRNHQHNTNNGNYKATKIPTTISKTKAPAISQQQGYKSYFYPINPDGSSSDRNSNFRNSQFEEQGYRCAYP